MPIHLSPTSRRHFLQSTLLFPTAPVLLRAAEDSSRRNTWALLSDTHIAADPDFIAREAHLVENLSRVVAEIMEERESIAGLIIDGDVAYNDGQPGDYRTLLDTLNPLIEAGLPVHCTLGNHDNRPVFHEEVTKGTEASPVESKHCSVLATPHANLVLLDTLRFVNKVEGEVGEAQRKWLASFLNKNPDKPAIVFGHHYPQLISDDGSDSEKKPRITGMIDSSELLDILESSETAKAFLYGHSHNWQVKPEQNGLHQINLPPTAYVFNESRPNGWVRAEFSETGMSLELRALDTSHAQHGETHKITWKK